MPWNRVRNILAVPLMWAVLTVALSAPSSAASSASDGPGSNSTYTRMDYWPPASTVRLRTGGYLNDNCLLQDVPCNGKLTGRYRKEATAQAKVIRELSGTPGFPGPPTSSTGPVQWEVAPAADGVCAPHTITKLVSDLEGENLEPPRATRWSPDECKFRVDVMVRDPGGNMTIIEVKRWTSSLTTPGNVKTQLGRYISNASALSLTFTENTQLTTRGWSRAYKDSLEAAEAGTWCVWADRDPLNPGQVYFDRWAHTPKAVRDRTDGGMGCDPIKSPGIDPKFQELVSVDGQPCPTKPSLL